MSDEYEGWTDGGVPDPRWDDDTILKVAQWEKLYLSLKGSTSSRRVYQSVGHVAYLECEWCKERTDYLLYLTPIVLASYVMYMIVIGVATSTWRKEAYRMGAGCAVLSALMMDAYLIGAANAKDFAEAGIEVTEAYSPFLLAFYVRHGVFIAVCLVLLVSERKQQYTDVEIVAMSVEKLAVVNNRMASARIARGVGMKSSNLRRRCFEYWRETADGGSVEKAGGSVEEKGDGTLRARGAV
jgi:hypothetical protein